MTLAVLSGNEAGKVLRSTRTRISVGSSSNNDLVLRDDDVAAFHFNVLIEDDGWRAEPVSSAAQIVVDKRWAHPRTGKRGALVYAAATELLAYPGEVEDAIIQKELRARKTDEHLVVLDEKDDTQRVSFPPASATRRSVPPVAIDDAAPTQTMPSAARGVPARDTTIDPLLLSSMPTVGDAPLAEVLAGRRAEPIVVSEPLQPVHPAKVSGSAWDRASRGRSVVPEVLAEPESQMRPVPGSESSAMTAIPVAPEPPRNAWGDASRRSSAPPPARASAPAPPKTSFAPPARPSIDPGASWAGSAQAPKPKPSRPPDLAPERALVPVATAELSLAALTGRIHEPALAVLAEPDGPLATAIRLFVTRLLDLGRSHGYRAYMLTSAEPLTGKTTVALNVALALAEDPRRRVALVEADFRNPRMGDILELPPELGLLGVLEGRLSVAEASIRVADRNLVLFPSGGKHPSPAEVLASPRFKTVIAELAQSVDVAIVDAPPVKPTADANLLLPLVDGAMLVVLNEETQIGWVEQALEQLGSERVLGAVYNHVDRAALKALGDVRKQRLAAAARR